MIWRSSPGFSPGHLCLVRSFWSCSQHVGSPFGGFKIGTVPRLTVPILVLLVLDLLFVWLLACLLACLLVCLFVWFVLFYPPVHSHGAHQRVPVEGKPSSKTPQSGSRFVDGRAFVPLFFSLFWGGGVGGWGRGAVRAGGRGGRGGESCRTR